MIFCYIAIITLFVLMHISLEYYVYFSIKIYFIVFRFYTNDLQKHTLDYL